MAKVKIVLEDDEGQVIGIQGNEARLEKRLPP